MAKKNAFSSLSEYEKTYGWVWWAVQLLLLPGVLTSANQLLQLRLSDSELNFTFFLINFLAVLVIFPRYLGRCAAAASQSPVLFLQTLILGYAAYYLGTMAASRFAVLLYPGFVNYNNSTLLQMGTGNYYLMLIGIVVLVPPAEECFYRGLFFRELYKVHPALGYIVSSAVFCLIHMYAYISRMSPLVFFLTFLQYIPAGLSLAWSYRKSGSVWAPILIHGFINYLSMQTVR